MARMDASTERVLAAYAGSAFVDGLVRESSLVEDEWDFKSRFLEAKNAGRVETKVGKVYTGYVQEASSRRSLRDWRRDFRRVGFRALWGSETVFDDAPENILLWRLAADWRTGLSWATDARFCHSVPVAAGWARDMTLWAALVPAKALLGIAWYGEAGLKSGCPLWRTVDHFSMGRVTVACDDFAEAFVDYVKLEEAGCLGPGKVVAIHRFDSTSLALAS